MPRLIFLAATLGCLAPALSAEQTGPVSQTGTASPASASDYELRGFFGAGDELEVSVRNTATGKSEWLRVGEKTEDLLVEKADSAAGTATLRAGDRHYRLRLAAEAPPDPLNAEEAKKLSPDEEARAQRKARIEAMRKNMTPEQMEAFGKIMLTKIPELEKAHPELFNGQPPDITEARRKINALNVSALHEAAEASAQLPGKDGKITPLPADFDAMMLASMNDDFAQMQKKQATAAQQPGPPAAPPPTDE